MKQRDLFGNVLSPRVGKAREKDIDCCEACFNASQKKCVCRCGGAFHGLGNSQKQNKTDDQTDPYITGELYGEIEKAIPPEKNVCLCGNRLDSEPIYYYPHSGGWLVKDFNRLLGLYKVCPVCNYQNALWKLGVPREREF